MDVPTTASGAANRAWKGRLIIVIWAPTVVFLPLDTRQLIINTLTTFLLVALLQNTQKRADDAVQQKLNAIAGGSSDLVNHTVDQYPDIRSDERELREAVGLERRETAG